MMLDIQSVTVGYGTIPVLREVSIQVKPGQLVAVVGPNGAGKSTLLKILTGKEEPESGRIELATGATLGFLQQHPEFEPNITVWEEAKTALNHLLKLYEKVWVERFENDLHR